MKTFHDLLNKELKDPEFKREYDALEPEFAMIQAMLSSGMSREEIAEKAGIAEAELENIETGDTDPTLSTLQKLAEAMGMILKVEYIPTRGQPLDPNVNVR